MRHKPARQQERVIDPSASGIGWFQLAAALEEFGSALAKPCYWDETTRRWKIIPGERRRNVYSTVEGVTASVDEFVPCWYNPAARGRWEVIQKPASANSILEYRFDNRKQGGTSPNLTIDPSNRFIWPASNYVAGSESTVGLKHYLTESTPGTNGNWECTISGLYRLSLDGTVELSTTSVSDINTGPASAGTAHTHTIQDWPNRGNLYVGPTEMTNLRLMLFCKRASGGAIAAFEDSIGSARSWWSNLLMGRTRLNCEWNVRLEQGDRIAFKFTTETAHSANIRTTHSIQLQDSSTMIRLTAQRLNETEHGFVATPS